MSNSTPHRPSWDETWLTVARTVAQRSLCDRDKVGAVIVSKSNRLLETGYNGPPSGFSSPGTCGNWCLRSQRGDLPFKDIQLDPGYVDCPSLHAEANALMRGDRSAREGGTIYVTSHVCFGCAKLIANSGLDAVCVDERRYDDDTTKHRNAVTSYDFLEKCGLTVYVAR